MKHTLMAAAILGAGVSLPASAQWGGFGDPGWGWKKPVCHVCPSAVQLTVVGGKGKGDKVAYQNDPVIDGGDTRSVSQSPTHYTGEVMVGLGPRLFVDASYRNVDTSGKNDELEVERNFTQIRYGAGVFVLSEPTIGALYLRAGGVSLKEDGDLSIKSTGETGFLGASRGYKGKSLSEFGGTLGGFWNKGSTRIEASYGIYGKLKEGNVAMSYAFNQRLYFVLSASLLDLSNRAVNGPFVGSSDNEGRRFEYYGSNKESILLYGAGLRLRF